MNPFEVVPKDWTVTYEQLKEVSMAFSNVKDYEVCAYFKKNFKINVEVSEIVEALRAHFPEKFI